MVKLTLASVAYQIGFPSLSKFRLMNAALSGSQWALAASELRDSRLYRQTTNRTERHAKRLESVAWFSPATGCYLWAYSDGISVTRGIFCYASVVGARADRCHSIQRKWGHVFSWCQTKRDENTIWKKNPPKDTSDSDNYAETFKCSNSVYRYWDPRRSYCATFRGVKSCNIVIFF